MKNKTLKRKIIKELKLLTEQTKQDPATSCMGRRTYCKSPKGDTREAIFRKKNSNKVECKCPKGYIKRYF